MLFTGASEVTIDAKGRLAIPAKYRNAWDPVRDGGAWFCVPWPGGWLRLYTESAFESMSKRLGDSLTASSQRSRLDTVLFGNAERLEMDGAGRIMLPKRHLRLTGLPSEVMVVGARNRLEVWSREAWEGREVEDFNRLSELIDGMEGEGLG